MKNTHSGLAKKIPTLRLGLLSLTLLAPLSHGAVTIHITGVSSSNTALVSLSGSVKTVSPIIQTQFSLTFVTLPTNTFPSGSGPLGTLLGIPSTTPASLFLIGSMIRGSQIDTAQVTYHSSFGPAASLGVDTMSFVPTNNTYLLQSSTSITVPPLATGDAIAFSGSFDLDLGTRSFADAFNEGEHIGNYGSDSVTLIVSSVPEPNVTILLGLASFGMLKHRRRS